MKGRRRAVRILAAAAVTVAAGAWGCRRAAPATHRIAVENFGFTPASLTIAVGDTVVWRNADVVPHTATARDSTWDSRSIEASGEWRWVAARPGRHPYLCVFHPTMRGTLEVR